MIPEVATIGAAFTLDAEAGLSISGEADLLVGVDLRWPDFSKTIDFYGNSGIPSRGLTPQVTKHFDITGQVGVTASVGLPAEIAFGVTIPST